MSTIPAGYEPREAGPAPFGPDTEAMVLFRDGTTCANSNRLCAANWEHRPTKGWGNDCDIVAVMLPEMKPSEDLHGREKPKGNSIMRIIMLIAAAFAAIIFSTPVQAQSLGDILGVIDSTRYNSCQYADGVYKTTCEVGRVSRVVDTFRQNSRQNRYEAANRLEQKISLIDALQRACRAGDAHSCQRVGRGMDQNRITAARALMDACRNGDTFSCDRAEAVLVGTDQAYTSNRRSTATQSSSPTAGRLSTTQARVGNCIVDINPETGMRTSGPYGCSR